MTITYHLTDDCAIFRRRWNKFQRRTEYIELKNKNALLAQRPAFLCQYVTQGEVMVKLWRGREEYLLILCADSIEYDWRESSPRI